MELTVIQTLYLPFVLSFVGVAVAVLGLLRLVPAVGTWWVQFATFLERRAFFLTTTQERNRLAVLRFFFGFIILMRAIDVARFLLPSEWTTRVGLFSGLELFFAVCVMLGLLTQLSLGFFIVVMWHIGERTLGTSTLGNDVGAMVAVFFLLTESGRQLSLDSLIIRRVPWLRPVLCYSRAIPGQTTITVAKFLMITAYWLVCVYSLSMHLGEPAWTTGVTGPMLFASNFMSRFHALIEPILLQSTLAVLLARISLIFMMVWYLVLMPWVVLGGWWRTAVIVWGILFYFLSAAFLQLGSLAYIEMIMWIACFWPKWGVDDTKKLLLFYDDKCNLCDRTVTFVRTVDVFDRVTLMPVSKNQPALDRYGIATDAALEDLHGVLPDSGTVRAGYALYEQLARHLLLLWVLIPLLWLGRVLWVGPALYRYVAERRRALAGVCTLPSPKPEWTVATLHATGVSPLFQIIACHMLLLAVAYTLAMPAPYLGKKGDKESRLAVAAHVYGIAPINVFNATDLHMVDNWFTLTDVVSGTVVPIFAPDGSRLSMHASDRLYFGNTIKFRRGEIGQTDCAFERREKSMRYLARVWLATTDLAGPRMIHYTQYHQPHPDQKLLTQNIYRESPVEIRCEVDFEIP